MIKEELKKLSDDAIFDLFEVQLNKAFGKCMEEIKFEKFYKISEVYTLGAAISFVFNNPKKTGMCVLSLIQDFKDEFEKLQDEYKVFFEDIIKTIKKIEEILVPMTLGIMFKKELEGGKNE